MIIALWAIPSILYILVITRLHAVYVPSLGGCVILELVPLLILIIYVSSFLPHLLFICITKSYM